MTKRLKLAAAALFAALSLALWRTLDQQGYTGEFIDDARYVVRAQSLLHGSYRRLESPGNPPATFPPPGFPALLVPVVAVTHAPWQGLRWYANAWTLATLFLLALWARRFLSLTGVFVLVASMAWHPWVAGHASSVMTEIPFTAFVLAAFLLEREAVRRQSKFLALALGIVLAGTSLIRMEGYVAFAAVVAAMVWRGERRLSGHVALAAAPVLLLWSLRAHALPPDVSDYVEQGGSGLLALIERGGARALFLNAGAWVRQVVTGFGGMRESGAAGSIWGVAVSAGLLALAIAWLIRSRTERGNERTALLFSAGYFVVHMVWPAFHPRYLVPLLPFLLYWAVSGGVALLDRPGRRRWGLVVTLAITMTFLFQDARLARQRLGQRTVPVRTLTWMSAHLPEESVVFSPLGPVVWLYAQRHAVYAVAPQRRDELRYQLLKHGVTHLLARPEALMSFATGGQIRPFSQDWERMQRRARDEGAFKSLFRDPSEATEVYSVVSSSSFVAGYELLERARAAMASGLWEVADRDLQAAVEVAPDMASAHQMLGTFLFLQKGSPSEGARHLEEAIRLGADDPRVFMVLAKLYESQGRTSEARRVLERGSSAAGPSESQFHP